MMDSKRGIQTKLAESINKSPSFFSGIKQGKPVNALHLKAAGLVFGAEKLLELMAIEIIGSKLTGSNQNNTEQKEERRRIHQNQRIGILSNFDDSEMARQMNLDMIEIEKLDRDHYLMLVGEIRGAARTLKPKKMA